MMGVVEPLPLPLNTTSNTQNEHPLSSNSNINDNQRRTNRRRRYQQKRTITITKDAKFMSIDSTLTTERCSKYMVLKVEGAMKLKIHRKRNHKTVRRLKEKLENIRYELHKQIGELEFKQKDLRAQIDHLRLYKQRLATKLEQKNFPL